MLNIGGNIYIKKITDRAKSRKFPILFNIFTIFILFMCIKDIILL